MKHTTESDGDAEFEDDAEPEYHPESEEAGEFWCPQCGSEMYGDATRCPKCGDYVTPGARPLSGRMTGLAWALIVLIVLGLLGGLIASFH
jgi:uncharacterized paraquat-inducible protein A